MIRFESTLSVVGVVGVVDGNIFKDNNKDIDKLQVRQVDSNGSKNAKCTCPALLFTHARTLYTEKLSGKFSGKISGKWKMAGLPMRGNGQEDRIGRTLGVDGCPGENVLRGRIRCVAWADSMRRVARFQESDGSVYF